MPVSSKTVPTTDWNKLDAVATPRSLLSVLRIVNEKSEVEELIKRYNEALDTLNDFDETLGDKAKPRKGANKLDHSEFWR